MTLSSQTPGLGPSDPLAAGSNLIGYVSSNAVRLSTLGRVFIGASAEVTASLGDDVRATLANPAGSGVNILLVKLAATSDGAGGLVIGDVYINPDTGLPTTEYTPFCTAVGAATAAGVFKCDAAATALSGGTATDLHIPLQGAGRTEFDMDAPIILSPGVTLGLNIPLGELESTNGAFAAYWVEEPV